jgi:hypothetical protein
VNGDESRVVATGRERRDGTCVSASVRAMAMASPSPKPKGNASRGQWLRGAVATGQEGGEVGREPSMTAYGYGELLREF